MANEMQKQITDGDREVQRLERKLQLNRDLYDALEERYVLMKARAELAEEQIKNSDLPMSDTATPDDLRYEVRRETLLEVVERLRQMAEEAIRMGRKAHVYDI